MNPSVRELNGAALIWTISERLHGRQGRSSFAREATVLARSSSLIGEQQRDTGRSIG